MTRSASKHDTWEDHYTRLAKKEGYPARSIFKLREIQQKYRLIKKGDKILDLGCSPGSWLLYAAELVGNSGTVIGIDLKPVTAKLPANAMVHTADVFSLDENMQLKIGNGFNGLLSDLAPATTGNKVVDTARSHELCRSALDMAERLLKPGGFFVCKVFQGADIETFVGAVKTAFVSCKIFKPQSSRKASKEIFVIGFSKKTFSSDE